MEWYEIVIKVLSSIIVILPLVVKLVDVTTAYVREQNWNKIIVMVTEYMVAAESMFSNGADKKSWVMEMIKTSAKVSNFDLTEENLEKISELIDELCALSKQINK
jgi:hypothetical protein